MIQTGFVAPMLFEARALAGKPIDAGYPVRISNSSFMIMSGIGAHRATEAVRILIAMRVTSLISWGSAAGLHPDLRPGSLVIPHTVLSRDGSAFQCSRNLYEWFCGTVGEGLLHFQGTLAETDQVVCGSDDKEVLHQNTGADSSDMESAAIAHLALEADIPFLAIRVILDSRQTTIPRCALTFTDEYGRLRLAHCIAGLFSKPSEIPGLVELALSYRKARATLDLVGRQLKRWGF
jgi:adenosylhomocysteine nucleosidase